MARLDEQFRVAILAIANCIPTPQRIQKEFGELDFNQTPIKRVILTDIFIVIFNRVIRWPSSNLLSKINKQLTTLSNNAGKLITD